MVVFLWWIWQLSREGFVLPHFMWRTCTLRMTEQGYWHWWIRQQMIRMMTLFIWVLTDTVLKGLDRTIQDQTCPATIVCNGIIFLSHLVWTYKLDTYLFSLVKKCTSFLHVWTSCQIKGTTWINCHESYGDRLISVRYIKLKLLPWWMMILTRACIPCKKNIKLCSIDSCDE